MYDGQIVFFLACCGALKSLSTIRTKSMKLKSLVLALCLATSVATTANSAIPSSNPITVTNPPFSLLNSWYSAWETVYKATYNNESFTFSSSGSLNPLAPLEFSLTGRDNFIQKFSYASSAVTYSMPVPGPEAGAGLGALALIGMVLLAKRRRDETSV